jgi:hypothetical protein
MNKILSLEKKSLGAQAWKQYACACALGTCGAALRNKVNRTSWYL